MRGIIFNRDDISKIDNKKIQDLKQKARANPGKKARFCLHRNTRESVHESIIVICKGVYIRPHKHPRKNESYHIIKGLMLFVVFDENGRVIEKFLMGKKYRSNYLVCRVKKNYWHMMIPVSGIVVFHETTKGPFVRRGDKVFAPWSPEESDKAGAEEFIKRVSHR